MTKPKITDITAQIVDLLTPFDTSERQRIVQASFMLLGEEAVTQSSTLSKSKENNENLSESYDGLSRQAKTWMKQNGITSEMLEQVFHVSDGEIDIIAADIPGKDIKAKTISAYILKGLSQLIISGDPNIDDKSARAFCKSSGCYSEANHAVYMKAVGNKITGSKDKGWKLTAPGLKAAAELVKELNTSN